MDGSSTQGWRDCISWFHFKKLFRRIETTCSAIDHLLRPEAPMSLYHSNNLFRVNRVSCKLSIVKLSTGMVSNV